MNFVTRVGIDVIKIIILNVLKIQDVFSFTLTCKSLYNAAQGYDFWANYISLNAIPYSSLVSISNLFDNGPYSCLLSYSCARIRVLKNLMNNFKAKNSIKYPHSIQVSTCITSELTVGRSQLMNRLCNYGFSQDHVSTLGANVEQKVHNQGKTQLTCKIMYVPRIFVVLFFCLLHFF